MVELIRMPAIEERRITKSGSSLIMTLPKAWVDENELTEGETILVRANGHLEIRKKTEENIKKMNEEVLAVRNQLNHNQMSSVATEREKSADS
ncbi:MAG: AbrB/MazE/SpoVT family DNA-binding domain-containing protein [Nanoarchaeota archaeon]|nr:AbrB/MazE/SpoVT family DNA-binding domain-containing protein [Nanoarchaeota archaeon]